jgi:hypothetical protein
VWGREVNGLVLTFHLAGINNQNFIMRDEQTGTYWQQISGRAISGPLAGKSLTLVPFDELTFALWKSEQPHERRLLPHAGRFHDGWRNRQPLELQRMRRRRQG